MHGHGGHLGHLGLRVQVQSGTCDDHSVTLDDDEALVAVLGVHIQIFWAEDEACRWLSAKLDESFEPESLSHAATELRQRERRAG